MQIFTKLFFVVFGNMEEALAALTWLLLRVYLSLNISLWIIFPGWVSNGAKSEDGKMALTGFIFLFAVVLSVLMVT